MDLRNSPTPSPSANRIESPETDVSSLMDIRTVTYAHSLEERQKACSDEDQEVDAAAPGTRRADLTVPIGYAFVPHVAMSVMPGFDGRMVKDRAKAKRIGQQQSHESPQPAPE